METDEGPIDEDWLNLPKLRYRFGLQTAICASRGLTDYFLPPFVESEPIFLQYFLGVDNVAVFAFLMLMFFVIRGQPSTLKNRTQPQEGPE